MLSPWSTHQSAMLSSPNPLNQIQPNLFSDLQTELVRARAHLFCPPPPLTQAISTKISCADSFKTSLAS